MSKADEAVLPHDALGIEIEDCAIEFRADKIVVLLKDCRSHYTLHVGNNSGVLDVHRTWTDETGQVKHQTLFAMRRDDIPALLGEFDWLLVEFLRLVRPLRVGWLAHHDIGIVRGLDAATDEDIAAVTLRRPRRKRLVIDEERWRENISVPEYLEEVWKFPDGAFSLFHRNRKIGIGIKATDRDGRKRLYWMKLRDLRRFFAAGQAKFLDTVLRHAIPTESHCP